MDTAEPHLDDMPYDAATLHESALSGEEPFRNAHLAGEFVAYQVSDGSMRRKLWQLSVIPPYLPPL